MEQVPVAAPPDWAIAGHETAVAGLAAAVAARRVRHAYLFTGPAGVGKTTLALALARALCCQNPPAPGGSCGACLACRKIARGVHPDVQTFSLATQVAQAERRGTQNSSLTIETAREIAAGVALRPFEAPWRVVVVDDAETMAGVAQEALLKTLEEPPPYVVLILLCDDAEALFPTIRSRCQIVDLRPVPRTTVVAALTAAGVDPAGAEELTALANGAPGWALRAAADPALARQRREAVERALAWVAAPAYERLVTAVRLGDAFSRKRADVYADVAAVLGVWRDALLLHAHQPSHLTHRGIAERLREWASGWSLAELHRAVRSVQTCLADLDANVRPRLALEAMVLQWPTSPPTTGPTSR